MVAKRVVTCPSCGQKNRVPASAAGTPRCATCHAPLPWIVDVGDADFTEVADQAVIPVLVDLWAPWCGPCRMVSPALEQLASDLAGRIKLVKVNVDEAPLLAQRFDARSIPTLVVTFHGKEVGRQIGAVPPPQLRAWMTSVLDSIGKAREWTR